MNFRARFQVMTLLRRLQSQRGATQLRFADVVTTLILLAILLYAAYAQFSVYQLRPATTPASSTEPRATPS